MSRRAGPKSALMVDDPAMAPGGSGPAVSIVQAVTFPPEPGVDVFDRGGRDGVI